MRYHAHKYKLDSGLKNLHKHRIIGVAEKMFGFGSVHFHLYYGISSYTDHTHYFSGFTGLPVKTEHGHIHKMEGCLELNLNHEHEFKGYTFEEISFISGKAFGEALV